MKSKKKLRTDQYILKRRFINKFNEPMEWQDKGIGVWIDLQTVQKQIQMLIRSHPERAQDIWFERNGELLDYNGNRIDRPMRYEKRQK